MKQKAKGLGDSGIMPVSGNEEPGVVARQSSNSSCVLPIKKRYSMLYTCAPIHPDPSFSNENENESKTKDSGLNLMKANPNTSSSPSRNVEDLVKPALAGQEAIGTTKVSVVVAKQGESHSKLELPVSSLSSLNKGKDISEEGSWKNKNDADDSAFINRCYWDLNTSMDTWIQDASQIDLLRKTSTSLDTKLLPISSASVIASNADKGKQLVGARKMNSPTVKLESVVETLVQANAGTAIRQSGAFEANVVKTEVVRHNMQSSELLEKKPVKCEPIQEEISDVIAPQSVGRVLPMPLTPQQEYTSTLSNCSDLSVNLSTPSGYSDHTNEANRSKNALDQANADKNANFDLKVLNVSSDKVEASVSASMNIEDHTVYKTTLNLVTSGKGLSNDDEKYEDSEIREPMMQSHADFLKRCDEKAEKLIWSSRSEREISLSNKRCGKVIYYMEEEKFHRRRNRFQDRSFGSSRGDFMRGRGRGSGRFDRLRRDRDSGRDFESYEDVADYRSRHKRTAVVGESENERNDYVSRVDGAAFASNRRKPLNDALPSFRHQPARRLSPNGRDDAAMMGIEMLRRAPRNISPSRCTGEDGSAYVGLRHSEKFNRDFPADISDPVYSHQQSMYDGPDGHFVQGNTKFTEMKRRGFPRMRSKSPVRSRTWSSPRRRLTEGFNSHQDSSQNRSPVMYREDRRRSSPQTSFTEEAIAPQRHDSPSYTARRLNDMRNVDAVQEHGHRRSLSSRRSPPDRVFTSTNRRVEILDHRERADGDGYFERPIHTGRFPELHSGEITDERRKYGERQGGPRQMRNVEEKDGGTFRQNEQLWHEDEFDVSRLKKRRY